MNCNLLLLLIGLAFFAAGAAILKKELHNKRHCTVSTTAEVSSYHMELRHSAGSEGRSPVYYPIFRYCASGQWLEQRSSVGRGRQQYELGERVEIRYDPAQPECFLVVGDRANAILSAFGLVAGFGVMLLSFFAD